MEQETSNGTAEDDFVSAPYESAGVTDICVDAGGEFVVLGARKGLLLVDCERPLVPVRTLQHRSYKASVNSIVQFHTKTSHREWIASSSNQNILIWNVNATSKPLYTTLRDAHKRAVNDLAWSKHSPQTLATCSSDGHIFTWDVRDPRRPSGFFSTATNGVAQLEWNRFDGRSLATVHDRELRIWDIRKVGAEASLAAFNAHMQSVFGVDWSTTSAHELATCGEDKVVKLWSTVQITGGGTADTADSADGGEIGTNDDSILARGGTWLGSENASLHLKARIEHSAPVWRVRYTPFGNGLVTIAKNLNPTVRMWSLNAETGGSADPVAVYHGIRALYASFLGELSLVDRIRMQCISWSHGARISSSALPALMRSTLSSLGCFRIQMRMEAEELMVEGQPK